MPGRWTTGAIHNDDLLTIRNDGIMQDGWHSVDASGALVPNPTPSTPPSSARTAAHFASAQ
jgi:hypothetical protein